MLATCRGLDAAGYEVSAVAFRGLASGQWSRHCSDRLRVTDPRADAGRFVADLRRYLERRPCAMLVPGSDFSLFAVSQRREALDGLTRLGLPSHQVVERSFNREVLATAAGRAGLTPAPAVRCATVDEAIAAANQFGYPVLMKSISTVRDLGDVVLAGPNTMRIADESELRAAVPLYGSAWLVQQMAHGRTLSFGGVMAGGRLIGVAVSQYLRTWPPQAGNVAFSVTIEPPPGLEDSVEALLRDVGWEGMFELELIQDTRGITPIDLNPRPYGSMALAIASGANLPGLWCDWVLGRDHLPVSAESRSGRFRRTRCGRRRSYRGRAGRWPAAVAVPAALAAALWCLGDGRGLPRTPLAGRIQPGVPSRAEPGRHYRWEDADLRHLLWQLRRRHWRAASRALRPWPRVVHAHFKVSDPLPLLVRLLVLAAGKIRARLLTLSL